jgi:Mg2+ and Co2+ transporter CorA
MDAAGLAAIGGSAVGVAGVAFGWLNSRGERDHAIHIAVAQHQHESDIARNARLHEEMSNGYAALLQVFYLYQLIVVRTHPMIGPLPAPPAWPPDEHVQEVAARASVIGSEDVVAAFEDLLARLGEFRAQVMTLDRLLAEHADAQAVQVRIDVEAARRRFNAQLTELERLMRADVRR